ncbi:MAG: chrB, partial [bacterium]
MNWNLLILSLPSDNATARTRIWRALKALGCAALRDGAWLLPHRPGLDTQLRQQAEEARAGGGSAWLLRLAGQDELEAELAGLFDRGPEYAGIDHALDELADADAEPAAQDKRLRGLRRQFEQLSAVDYFPGPTRAACAARLERVAALVRGRRQAGEPSAARGVI